MKLSIVVAAIPVLLTIAVFLGRTHLFPMGGDEPHYLIMAESLLTDHDVDLKNNYERDADDRAIYGPVVPHVLRTGHGWISFHSYGLPVLVALPFALGGARAVRLFLCVFAGFLPWMLFRWLAPMIDPKIAGWTIVGTMLAVPMLFGSTQIFPDLPAGVISTALACWLLIRARERDGPSTWPLFWLISGLLPSLNPKFAGATIVFALGGAGLVCQLFRTGRRAEARLAAWSLPLVTIGVLLLAKFNLYEVGSVWGPRSAVDELTRSPLRALMIFAGLHLDQSQGMFFLQPLLLAGVAALIPFARARPRFALFWALLYGSLIVPNSMELARYGLGPADRFAWSAMWLWVVPLGFALASYDLERFVRPAVIAALVYQMLIALRWVYNPGVLFTQVTGPRDSPFSPALVHWLPSFYTWDFITYTRDPANQIALIVVAGLMVAGAYGATLPPRAPQHDSSADANPRDHRGRIAPARHRAAQKEN